MFSFLLVAVLNHRNVHLLDRYVLNVCYPIRNDRIGNSPVEILIKN